MMTQVETEASDSSDVSELSDLPENSLEGLPPSAKLVLKVLEYEGPMSQKKISETSRLSPRTTRKAVKELKESGLVESSPSLKDGRKKIYRLSLELD